MLEMNLDVVSLVFFLRRNLNFKPAQPVTS
jgi:hypothetical protein